MRSSIRSVIEYLERKDPELARDAKKRYSCLQPWVEDPQKYGLAALRKGHALCEEGVVKMLGDLLQKLLELAEKGGESYLDAEVNARVVHDTERYYRAMYYGDAKSWNLRDQHMFDTPVRLLKAKPGANGWDEPMEIKEILLSREDSYERIMHNTGIPSFLLDLRESVENADMRPALDIHWRYLPIGHGALEPLQQVNFA